MMGSVGAIAAARLQRRGGGRGRYRLGRGYNRRNQGYQGHGLSPCLSTRPRGVLTVKPARSGVCDVITLLNLSSGLASKGRRHDEIVKAVFWHSRLSSTERRPTP